MAQIGQGIGGFLGAAHGTSEALSNLNEGRKLASDILTQFEPTGFGSAGLSGGFADNRFTLTRSAGMEGRLAGLDTTFNRTLGGLDDLMGRIRPGFSELRKSRITGVENARRRSIGNLRENLAKRRVLGSSFGQDALVRANLEFQQEEDRIKAESTLQEIDATRQLIAQANEVGVQRDVTALNQFNFESQLSAGLSSQITQIMAANTQMNAQLTAEMFAQRAGVWVNWQTAHLSMLQDSLNNSSSGGGAASAIGG